MASLAQQPPLSPSPRFKAEPIWRVSAVDHSAARDAWTRAALALEYPDWHDLAAWTQFRAQTARLSEEHLSTAADAALKEFFAPATAKTKGGAEFLILEGLPVDPHLPAVPRDGLRPGGKQTVSEAVIAGLIGRRAEILAFANEKGGSPIHEIAPMPGFETTQSNAGRTAMNFHSDGAFLPSRFRPRGLLLFGLVNTDTATLVLTAEQIMDAASPALRRTLAQPWFRHARPQSFTGPGVSQPAPILWRDASGAACVAVASSSIEPMNDEARSALDAFRTLCGYLAPTRVVIAPGTALLFRNDRVLHGRETVAGTRWLQRAYFIDSLAPLRQATHSDPRAFCFDAQTLLKYS